MMSVNWSEFAMRQPFLTDLGEGSSAAAGRAGALRGLVAR